MIDITEREISNALCGFISSILPGVAVIKGQVNRVPMPKKGFVIVNPLSRTRLAVPEDSYTDTEEEQAQHVLTRMQCAFQVDFYGEESADWAQTFANLANDQYAYNAFAGNIKPLYCSDPSQMPLIDGEKQYTERWRVDMELQANPSASVPMTFFDEVDINLPPL